MQAVLLQGSVVQPHALGPALQASDIQRQPTSLAELSAERQSASTVENSIPSRFGQPKLTAEAANSSNRTDAAGPTPTDALQGSLPRAFDTGLSTSPHPQTGTPNPGIHIPAHHQDPQAAYETLKNHMLELQNSAYWQDLHNTQPVIFKPSSLNGQFNPTAAAAAAQAPRGTLPPQGSLPGLATAALPGMLAGSMPALPYPHALAGMPPPLSSLAMASHPLPTTPLAGPPSRPPFAPPAPSVPPLATPPPGPPPPGAPLAAASPTVHSPATVAPHLPTPALPPSLASLYPAPPQVLPGMGAAASAAVAPPLGGPVRPLPQTSHLAQPPHLPPPSQPLLQPLGALHLPQAPALAPFLVTPGAYHMSPFVHAQPLELAGAVAAHGGSPRPPLVPPGVHLPPGVPGIGEYGAVVHPAALSAAPGQMEPYLAAVEGSAAAAASMALKNVNVHHPQCTGHGNVVHNSLYLQSFAPSAQPTPHSAREDAESRILMGDSLQRAGNVDLAIYHYRMALWLHPENSLGAVIGLANCFVQKSDTTTAQRLYTEALRVQPSCAPAWCGIAGLYNRAGNTQRAVLCYREALAAQPECADAYRGLGQALKDMGRLDEAAQCYQAVLPLQPGCARTFAALAGIQFELKNLDASIGSYQEALRLNPNFPEAYNDLGNALRGVGRYAEAVSCYTACLQLHAQTAQSGGTTPHLLYFIAVTYNNLAGVLKLQSRNEEACACYEHVTRLQPTSAEAHANLGHAYKDATHLEQAISSYNHALAIKPDYPAALANLVHTLQMVCDWRERGAVFARLEADISRQVAQGQASAVQPFHALAYPLRADLVLDLTKMHAHHVKLAAQALKLPPFVHPRPQPLAWGQRLKLGYLSSDFGNHPLSHLMGSVFGLHERSRVEVFCYALSAADGTEWRARIEAEAEHFLDVSALSSAQICSTIHQQGIQVLVDLNGYTKGARNEILALRPAPVQVSYMGFPATTGADFIDYLVTDKVTTPPEHRHCYSEKLAFMPHSYFVNDYKRSHQDVLDPANLPTRSQFGLPEDAIIFSCSNQLYKFDPETFEVWCRILNRVPNSVLWLLRFPAYGEPRVKAYAAARGVDPSRVIFTDVVAKDMHIKRSGLADIFLDTPLCNAHTTGCDVLWSGAPCITLPLERMASRVCASLCTAMGFGPEMVVNSYKEYEERAVEWALDPGKLAELRRRVCSARLRSPLFDTVQWVKDFDEVLLKMWRIHSDGQPPRDFDLGPPR